MSITANPAGEHSVPKLTRILRYLEQCIGAIRPPQYRSSLTAVRPIIGQEIERLPGRAVIYLDSAQPMEAPAAGCSGWIQTIVIEVYLGQSETSTVSLDELMLVVMADIEMALIKNDSDWSMNGESEGTTIQSIEPFLDPQSKLVALEFTIAIAYQTAIGNAYQ